MDRPTSQLAKTIIFHLEEAWKAGDSGNKDAARKHNVYARHHLELFGDDLSRSDLLPIFQAVALLSGGEAASEVHPWLMAGFDGGSQGGDVSGTEELNIQLKEKLDRIKVPGSLSELRTAVAEALILWDWLNLEPANRT